MSAAGLALCFSGTVAMLLTWDDAAGSGLDHGHEAVVRRRLCFVYIAALLN